MRNNLVIGFIAGAAVGMVSGLLFAPQPGKESRHLAVSRASGIRHKTAGYLHLLRCWRKSEGPLLVGPYDWRGV